VVLIFSHKNIDCAASVFFITAEQVFFDGYLVDFGASWLEVVERKILSAFYLARCCFAK